MGWYSEVSRDVGKIPEAIKHYESELIDARKEVKLAGNVEKIWLCPALLNILLTPIPRNLSNIKLYEYRAT